MEQVDLIIDGELASDGIISDQEEFCPWCGLTRRELYAEGKMGCAKCYETFAVEATRALKEIHGEDEHVGKT